MPDARFVAFLRRSFDVLAREFPEALRVLTVRMGPRTVVLAVDDERVQVRFGPRTPVLEPPDGSAAVTITTTRDAILDVVDCGTALTDAVLDDRLVLEGALADLLAFHDGLLDYVHGAVRAPSFPGLLAAFRDPLRRTP